MDRSGNMAEQPGQLWTPQTQTPSVLLFGTRRSICIFRKNNSDSLNRSLMAERQEGMNGE